MIYFTLKTFIKESHLKTQGEHMEEMVNLCSAAMDIRIDKISKWVWNNMCNILTPKYKVLNCIIKICKNILTTIEMIWFMKIKNKTLRIFNFIGQRRLMIWIKKYRGSHHKCKEQSKTIKKFSNKETWKMSLEIKRVGLKEENLGNYSPKMMG